MTEPAAIAKMRAHGKTEAEIADFSRAFNRVYSGERTLIPERMIDPLTSIRSLSSLETPQDAAQAISHTAVLKLNGGIGTTMGLNGPKSLLEAHEGRTFLDIALGQLLWLREHYQIPLPFILLNSDATASATQKALGAHNAPTDGIPSTVLQTVVQQYVTERVNQIADIAVNLNGSQGSTQLPSTCYVNKATNALACSRGDQNG